MTELDKGGEGVRWELYVLWGEEDGRDILPR